MIDMGLDREVEIIRSINNDIKELMRKFGYGETHIIGIIGSAIAEAKLED